MANNPVTEEGPTMAELQTQIASLAATMADLSVQFQAVLAKTRTPANSRPPSPAPQAVVPHTTFVTQTSSSSESNPGISNPTAQQTKLCLGRSGHLSTAMETKLGRSTALGSDSSGSDSGSAKIEAVAEEKKTTFVDSGGAGGSGRRRVYVQTETGCVFGMELDRDDNAHTVKRRLQVALNVPTDGSSLTFGDLVLKNDLSAVRNNSPLLLTRNLMHRSSSTPCLSPTGRDLQQRDWSGPLEILRNSECFAGTMQMVKEVKKAIKMGVDPIPVHSGLGGAYYFRNRRGESVAILKPTDEESFTPNNPKGFVGKALGQPGLKRSVRVGETSTGVVAGEKKKAAKEVEKRQRVNHTGDFPVIERRKQQQPFQVNEQGWPLWLLAVASDAIQGWTPRRANTFEKLSKIGQGTYSNVYKARDLVTGKIVALKKVRFDNLEPESVKFMAREINVLRKLDHPNVVKLEGLVSSRMSCSLYLVFEYMEHDLSGLAASTTGIKFSESQIKCYMKQLLSGLEHCHSHGVLHRDIKGSNLLIDNEGVLKIADFGLATFFDPHQKQPMTSRVVTLWYRPPELLLGATFYGVGVDLWSAGCILAELLSGKPIMPGRTEVEQLHEIFKLCGSPSEDYWKKYKLPNATLFKPQQPYKRCLTEMFKEFPPSSVPLIDSLLSIDSNGRGTATAALNSEFFTTEPFACEPSSLPKYPPSKEMDVKLRDAESRRQRGLNGKNADAPKKVKARDRAGRVVPVPEANAENQGNLDRWRAITQTNTKSKSEKFPPPHQDGAVGYPEEASHKGPLSFFTSDASFGSMVFNTKSSASVKSMSAAGNSSRRRKTNRENPTKGSLSEIHPHIQALIDRAIDESFIHP